MKAIILAGGKGTRLATLNQNIPKPMTLLCGKPVLQREIDVLRREGIQEICLTVGYKDNVIRQYFGDGRDFGVKISYFIETAPLGTAGALFQMNLQEDCLVCSGDLVFDFSLKEFIQFHLSKNALATLFVHPSTHPQDSTLLKTDPDGRVLHMLSYPQAQSCDAFLCNAGIQIISPLLFQDKKTTSKVDLDRDVLQEALSSERVWAYRSNEYVRDMGTPERLKAVSRDISQNESLCFPASKKKAIFLDRDGTVNIYKGYITDPNQIELIPHVAETIQKMHEAGYLVVLVTNQPVIARGECDEQTMFKIHQRLEFLLSEKGTYLDRIYYCPHHPQTGFQGERAEYKIPCDCRKPAPGMLIKAAQELSIDLSSSYMIGDSWRDVEAAQNAGCIPVLLAQETNRNTYSESNIHIFQNLQDFCACIIMKESGENT